MKIVRNVVLLVGAVGLVAGIWWLYLHLNQPQDRAAVLRVESEPPDAEIWIDGRLVGRTPLALENDYPPREYEVLVRKKGSEPWKGQMFGGVSTRLNARLARHSSHLARCSGVAPLVISST